MKDHDQYRSGKKTCPIGTICWNYLSSLACIAAKNVFDIQKSVYFFVCMSKFLEPTGRVGHS